MIAISQTPFGDLHNGSWCDSTRKVGIFFDGEQLDFNAGGLPLIVNGLQQAIVARSETTQ